MSLDPIRRKTWRAEPPPDILYIFRSKVFAGPAIRCDSSDIVVTKVAALQHEDQGRKIFKEEGEIPSFEVAREIKVLEYAEEKAS